jgi:diguanylate cyclase (GGDEF)-like protein
MVVLTSLEKKSRLMKIILGLLLIGVVGILDFYTGYELAFSLFYIIPLSLATWLLDRRYGVIASLISAFVWVVADAASGHTYSHPLIPVWNTFIRLSFFIIITWLLSAVKRTLEHEKELSYTDYLTGAVNLRLFLKLVEIEINRSQRLQCPLTLAYIDLDNFKSVNDEFGHLAGDEVLRAIARTAKKQLRKTDIIARLGGDEFALLLPETSQEAARVVLAKLQAALFEEMQQNHWPITFSIGVVTCEAASPNTEELIRMADERMYSVKNRGKNNITYAMYAES